MASEWLMRIPYLRRPFHQRDVARRERDAALRALAQRAPAAQADGQRDVAEWFGCEALFWHPSQDEAQDRRIGDFRAFIAAAVVKDRPSLEVGPSHRPILAKRLGYRVTVVDHADEGELARKYTAFGVDVSAIEPVDVIWTGDRLAPLMPGAAMAAIVASHMIEHATDFIGFLDDCTDLLAQDGRILLVVPDQRYCFDMLHAPSDVGKLLDDHRHRRRVHSAASLYRNVSNVAARVGGVDHIAWGQHAIDDIVLQVPDPHAGLGVLPEATQYIDSHENYFTPLSFLMLIEELRHLGRLRLAPYLLTRTRGCEFLVVLGRSDRPPLALDAYVERKKFLALGMLREQREWLNSLHGLLGA